MDDKYLFCDKMCIYGLADPGTSGSRSGRNRTTKFLGSLENYGLSVNYIN